MPNDQLQEAVEAFRSDFFARTGARMNATVVRSGLKAALPHLRASLETPEPESPGSEQTTKDWLRSEEAVQIAYGVTMGDGSPHIRNILKALAGEADSWCENHSAPMECVGESLRVRREPVLLPHAEPERSVTETYRRETTDA